MSSAGPSNCEDAYFSERGELDAVGEICAEYLRFEVNKITLSFSKISATKQFFCICIFNAFCSP